MPNAGIAGRADHHLVSIGEVVADQVKAAPHELLHIIAAPPALASKGIVEKGAENSTGLDEGPSQRQRLGCPIVYNK